MSKELINKFKEKKQKLFQNLAELIKDMFKTIKQNK
jgi:hypothetical protein